MEEKNDWYGIDENKSEEKRVLGEGGVLTDEDIAALQPEAEKAQKDFDEYKTEKVKKNIATKDDLIGHANRIFDLEVDIGDKILIFKVRRMTERERSKYNKINFDRFGPNFGVGDMTPEQFEAIQQQGYEMMAELIIDPKMSVNEWKEILDSALLDHLSSQVAKLSIQVNDAILIEDFKKK